MCTHEYKFFCQKPLKTENSNPIGFELHRPSSNGKKFLFPVITKKKKEREKGREKKKKLGRSETLVERETVAPGPIRDIGRKRGEQTDTVNLDATAHEEVKLYLPNTQPT